MRPKSIAILLGVPGPLRAAAASQKVKDLPPRYRAWLEEEVVYIISPKEKAVFLQLGNDRSARCFITAFWKARDRTRTRRERVQGRALSPHRIRQQEFRPRPEGRRLAVGHGPHLYHPWASRRTSRVRERDQPLIRSKSGSTPGLTAPGCRTRSMSSSSRRTRRATISSIPLSGTAPEAHAVLQRRHDELPPGLGRTEANRRPNVAEVSMSLIPRRIRPGHESHAGVRRPHLSKIPKMGYDSVKDAYAEKLLRYKDIVEVEYTANYIENDALVQITRDPAGRAFVHFLIEPARLSIERMEGLYRTVFDVTASSPTPPARPSISSTARSDRARRRTVLQDQGSSSVLSGRLPPHRGRLQDQPPPEEHGLPRVHLLRGGPQDPARREPHAERADPGLQGRPQPGLRRPDQSLHGRETQLVASPRNDFTVQDTLTLFCEAGGLTEE